MRKIRNKNPPVLHAMTTRERTKTQNKPAKPERTSEKEKEETQKNRKPRKKKKVKKTKESEKESCSDKRRVVKTRK